MADTSKRDSMDASAPDLSSKMQCTTISSPEPAQRTTAKSPPTLTSLPGSIRNKIYSYLLDTELVNVGRPNVSYTHNISSSGILEPSASRSPFPVSTALFYTNKQLSREALTYFYSKNLFIRFSIYTSDARHAKTLLADSGLLYAAPPLSHLENSKQHVLDLSLTEKSSAQKRAAIIFPAQYLPRLINFLDQASQTTKAWAPSHALFIEVRNTYDYPLAKLQGDALELFRLLSNLGKVEIDGKNLLPGYAEGLASSMMASSFTAPAFLETATHMADAADAAREKRDWALGHQHAQSCIIALTYAYLTRAELLHSQPEAFTRDIQRLRWRCELGIAKALFKQHQAATASGAEWLMSDSAQANLSAAEAEKRKQIATDLLIAETAASAALSLATDSPNPASNPWFQSLPAELIPPNKAEWFSDAETALSWYACGIVHTALGENLFAAGDLERACGLKADGKNFAEAFERAREGIDWEVKPGTGLRRAAKLARG
ncbi:hypothetical protein K491DRAFT_690174 [Lophiostoma macrostomum CBS 122681]|uniref:F-box domain-containing protein n=1 Tax=Lophiostoma macrostomum CBS 122681 TaxID=1314788 RepID=A0A6A6TEK4_9PLEO|nr:hypothetical protein K491DRAFT_690174 [Lophiostoma macrostomum CBS 122681]